MSEISKSRAEVYMLQVWGDELRVTRGGYQWTAIQIAPGRARQIICALQEYVDECVEESERRKDAMREKLGRG